jgi:hypothetical protein
VDGLEYLVYYRYLSTWNDGKHIAEKCTVQRWYFALRLR